MVSSIFDLSSPSSGSVPLQHEPPSRQPFRYSRVRLAAVETHQLATAAEASLAELGQARLSLLQGVPELAPFIAYNTNTRPLRRVLNAAVKLYGAFGIIEDPYLDLEYLDGHAAALDQCYTRFPPICNRLHFFEPSEESPTDPSRIVEILSNGGSEKDVLKYCRYRGFAVLKPTSSHCLGRTRLSFNEIGILPAPGSGSSRIAKLERPGASFLEAGTHTYVHILCARFVVHAADFVQQDHTTGRCASAAIWGALRQAKERFGLRELSFAEIGRKALKLSSDGFTNASFDTAIGRIRGFTQSEIQQALAASGGRPLIFYPKVGSGSFVNEQYAKFNLHSLIDSGIAPVIALDPLTDDKSHGHAVLGVGHAFTANRDFVARQLAESSLATWMAKSGETDFHNRQWMVSSFVPLFYTNDDNEGPYRRLLFADMNRLRSSNGQEDAVEESAITHNQVIESVVGTEANDDGLLYSESHFSYPVVSAGRQANQVQYLSELYAPCPSLVTVEPADLAPQVVELFHRTLLKSQEEASGNRYVIWRALLLSCSEWRQSLVRRGAAQSIRSFYSSMHLPRFLWVFELSIYRNQNSIIDEFCSMVDRGNLSRAACRRIVHGEVLCDATSPMYVYQGPAVASRLYNDAIQYSGASGLMESVLENESDAELDDFALTCIDVEELRSTPDGEIHG